MKKLYLFLLLSACGNKNESNEQRCWANRSNDNKIVTNNRLVVFGDSISEKSGFAEIVAQDLDKDIWNAAVGGSRIDCQIEQMINFKFVETDTVIFMAGLNDVRYGVSAEEFEIKLQAAIDILKENGVEIILATTMKMLPETYAWHEPYNNATDGKVEEYRDIILSLGLSNNLEVINVTDSWIPLPEYYLGDMIHPNAEGGSVLADIYIEQMNSN